MIPLYFHTFVWQTSITSWSVSFIYQSTAAACPRICIGRDEENVMKLSTMDTLSFILHIYEPVLSLEQA